LLGIAARLVGTGNHVAAETDWGAYAEPWQPIDEDTGEVIEPWTEAWWMQLTEPPGGHKRWLGASESAEAIQQALAGGEFWAYLVSSRDDTAEVDLGYLLRADDQWQRLTRIRGAVRSGLVTSAHLPAFRSPAETLRVTDWTWYGKLVRRLYQEGRAGKETDFENAERQLSGLVDEAFRGPGTQIEKTIGTLVPGVKVRFQAGPYTLDDAHKGVSLFVDDGVDAPFDEKGAGVQALVLLALFRCYCENFHQASSLLLLEEPENFLHPHGRRALATSLRQFADEVPEGRQVIMSTHSETFVKLGGIEGLRLIRKSDAGSVALRLDATHEHAQRWRQILSSSPELVFAEHVILVEGGEVYVVPAIANQVLGGGVLDRRNFSVVRVEGKEDFKKHATLLQALSVGWTVLTDRDFLDQGWKHFKDRLPAGVNPGDRVGLSQALEILGIFVNQRGELEDLYTARGREYVTAHGKDRAAMLIAREIEDGTRWQEFFEDIGPFEKALRHAVDASSRLHVGNGA